MSAKGRRDPKLSPNVCTLTWAGFAKALSLERLLHVDQLVVAVAVRRRHILAPFRFIFLIQFNVNFKKLVLYDTSWFRCRPNCNGQNSFRVLLRSPGSRKTRSWK